MLHVRRYTMPLLGAGFLALVALASFLILGLTGVGPDSASDLPVVDIGQADEGSSGQGGTANPQSAAEGAQTTPEARQNDGRDQGTSEGVGSGGPTSGPGQQSGSGQQGGLIGPGGNGPSTSTTAGPSPPGAANTAPPSTGTSGTTPTGNGPGTMGVSGGTGTTGSTLRQTVNGGVRVEGGTGSGPGMGSGSNPPASGKDR